MMNMVNYAPVTFLCIYLFSHYKTATVLRIAITFQMIGGLIRGLCYFKDTYWTIILGSWVCVSIFPFTINCQTIIANIWFTENERGIATALQTLGLPLGSVLGYGMVAVWFKDRK